MKCSTSAFIYGCFAIFPASSAVQLRIPIGILDLEEVEAELGTELFRLMLHEVSQYPGNGWQLPI